MISKVFVVVIASLCLSNQVAFAQESDWELLSLAIANPNTANPTVLAGAIRNIVNRFFAPPNTTVAPATTPAA
jgi:hypothetical protein